MGLGHQPLIDGLDQVKSQLNIDMTKIASAGCSYAGKMSLFGGAFDERVALTIAEESGGGGINAWRTSQDFVARTSTSIEKIDNTNYSWFMSSMKSLDPYKLPHDHHELIAMIAPRATIILGNDDYDWLGDESGYKSTMAAIRGLHRAGRCRPHRLRLHQRPQPLRGSDDAAEQREDVRRTDTSRAGRARPASRSSRPRAGST